MEGARYSDKKVKKIKIFSTINSFSCFCKSKLKKVLII